jgi:aryl-alcohol dehydrogenase-like predicted oxidoreductase
MKMRRLGKSAIEVAPLAFGGNVFGWTVDEGTGFKLLDAFVEAGLNLIDTADVYSRWASGNSGGESEELIGRWLKRTGKRHKVVIATKVGMEMGPTRKGLSRSHILGSVEDSLRRLNTDYIDLYQSHTDDAETPIEETLETYAKLIEQGKVRSIGASNFTPDRLSKSVAISRESGYPSYCCLQPLYNLYERSDYEARLEPVCVKEGLAVISYFSLARGFLTGKYRSEADLKKSPRGAGIKKYLDERGSRILDALDTVASQHHSTPARVSLAWLIARPSITAPIASATTLEQMRDLIEATRLDLGGADIDLLNEASAQ